MKNIAASLILISALIMILPLPASAFSLVPCGSSEYPEPCQLRHLVILVIRLINYLISVAAIVAMYQILFSGWTAITAMGNTEKIEKAKATISNAVVGFAMIVLAFVLVNLLVNVILGDKDAPREWWRPECIYSINPECPLNNPVRP